MSELSSGSKMHPLTLFALTFVVASIGFVLVGPLIGVFLSIPFIEGNFVEQLQAMLLDPVGHPEFKVPLFIIQGSATFFGLGLLPAVFWFSIEKKGISSWFAGKKNYGILFLVVAAMTIAFMVTNSVFIQWNATIHFPDFMKGFELWAREFEDKNEALTKYLTQFSSTGEFILAFVVIAILPAFAEELVFRGMLQTQLARATKNHHVAIWATAMLFSAFHFQFFGFVPRMLLGAMFGYLYFWSGNLFIVMFAHFVNNGFSVLMLYLNQKRMVEIDMESTEAAPWQAVVIFTLIGGTLLFYFKKFYDKRKEQVDGE